MNVEDAIGKIGEALPDLDGFGSWRVVSPHKWDDATSKHVRATAYVEINDPNDECVSIHLVANPVEHVNDHSIFSRADEARDAALDREAGI